MPARTKLPLETSRKVNVTRNVNNVSVRMRDEYSTAPGLVAYKTAAMIAREGVAAAGSPTATVVSDSRTHWLITPGIGGCWVKMWSVARW